MGKDHRVVNSTHEMFYLELGEEWRKVPGKWSVNLDELNARVRVTVPLSGPLRLSSTTGL
jgi:hypothetical protein